MAFKEVNSLDADVTVALGKTDKSGKPYPKQAEGYFLGSRAVQNKRGESKLHFLQTVKGNLGIWGTTDLDRKLGQAPVGSMVRITSTGTRPTPNGDMYTYKVEVDSDNTIEVSTASTSEDSSETENYAVPQSFYDDADEEDADQSLALAAAERKAKVEALLKGNKSKSAKN
jgi:hypothetical protein